MAPRDQLWLGRVGGWVGCPGASDLPESSKGQHEAGLLYPESLLGSAH